MELFAVDVQIMPTDLERLSRAAFRRRPFWQRRGIDALLVIGPMLLAYTAAVLIANWSGGRLGDRVVIAAMAALLLFLLLQIAVRRFAFQLAFGKGGANSQVSHLSLSDEGLVSERPRIGRSVTYWSGIYDVVEDQSALFVLLDNAAGVIIPKRSFANDADAIRFYTELQRRWRASAGSAQHDP